MTTVLTPQTATSSTAGGTSPEQRALTSGPGRSHQAAAGRYLTITVAGEVYALDIGVITEIIAHRALTSVPMMPGYIRGVMNLRGRVLPVVDLAARFGRHDTEVGRRTCIVVVEVEATEGRREIGVLVDGVTKVVHLMSEDFQDAPDFGVGIPTDYIAGMARLDARFVVVLDVENVLGAAGLSDLAEEC